MENPMAGKEPLYYNQEPPCKVIGPQLGASFGACGMKITIAFPHLPSLENVVCVLTPEKGIAPLKQSAAPGHPVFRHFLFEFQSLVPGMKYAYAFLDAAGSALDLGPGLTAEDCWFLGPSFGAEDCFVLHSCNNPFYSGLPEAQRFNMWEKLAEQVFNDRHIRLIVQGGDQVYNDDIEGACLAALRGKEADADGVRRRLVRNYQHFYSYPAIRRVLAHVPSVAMWDDHDITDGWGGRPESFRRDGAFAPEWLAYFNLAREAFRAYQSAKNPPPLSFAAETAVLDFGVNRLVILDLRSEKNIMNASAPLVGMAHEKAILDAVASTPEDVSRCFILTPVVPVRIDPHNEEILKKTATWLYRLRTWSGYMPGMWGAILRFVSNLGGIADLGDDLTDGLSAAENAGFLRKLLKSLANLHSRTGKGAVILTGDIHTGGISEIFAWSDDNRMCVIPQVVSSPIGYIPMNRHARAETTEEKEFVIEKSEGKTGGITARNIFYRSDRNFAVICPDRIAETDGVRFFFENLKLPIACPAYFSRAPAAGKAASGSAEKMERLQAV
jgi:hypothetical protein